MEQRRQRLAANDYWEVRKCRVVWFLKSQQTGTDIYVLTSSKTQIETAIRSDLKLLEGAFAAETS
jgi:hypothetical protein